MKIKTPTHVGMFKKLLLHSNFETLLNNKTQNEKTVEQCNLAHLCACLLLNMVNISYRLRNFLHIKID